MAYTTNQLISGAYYESGVVSREFETVSGTQISDGLGWLNDIISEKRVDEGMIPYETKYVFNAVVGQETYWIPNLTKIDTLVFYLEKVRYSMSYTQRNQYFGSPRVENINTLPFEWYWERKVGGGNLHIYFWPDQNYPMEIHGVFELNSVSLGQDLSSNSTVADLGVPTAYGLSGGFSLSPGQLVINTNVANYPNATLPFDLTGNYANIGALLNYINSGIIPGVSAYINVNDFVITSNVEPPLSIYIQSSGYPPNGTSFIGPVAAATTTNLNATYNNGAQGVGATLTATAPGVLVVDGYTPVLNDRILVIDETNPAQNGSYQLTTVGTALVAYVLTRTTNYDQSFQVGVGNLFTVTNGAINGGRTFIQTADVSFIGISAILFSIFNTLTFSNFSLIGLPLYEIFNPNGFDQFYITYLRYALADRICSEYNYETPVNVQRQLAKYESWINQKSRILDLEMKKTSTLQKRATIGWAWVNLGRGWFPPS